MVEYRCIDKCFFRNTLVNEGAVVLADPKEMEGNCCFVPVNPVVKKSRKKSEESR